eukprot:evm.model.scf_1975.3 EVM.evm.TU.scf_1975.3   scf_1975:22474-23850(-)
MMMVTECCGASQAAPSPVTRAKQAGAALLAGAVIATGLPAYAGADLALGEDVFNGNCAACHAGGQNSVEPDKPLSKDAIGKNLSGGFSESAIKTQVINGKGAMPAWGDRLDDDEIASVAAYVYQKSNSGW